MSRNSRRAVATAIAGVLAIAPLSACAAGQTPQSALPTRLTEGVNASAQHVGIRNAFLLGPAPGQRLAAGGSMPLYAWFVNHSSSPDRLVAAEAPGVAQSVQIAGGAIDLPPGALVNTVEKATPSPAASSPAASSPGASANSPTPKAAGARRPKTIRAPKHAPATTASVTPGQQQAAPPSPSSKLILQGIAKDFSGGEEVRVTLHFQRAGAIMLNVPVVPQTGYYATYSPAPAEPTPSATPLPVRPKSTSGSTPKARSKKKPSATPSA